MFQDPDFQQIQNVLLRIVRDRKRWHDAKYTVKTSGLVDPNLESRQIKLHKDTFAWYKTLEKNIVVYMRAVMKLDQLETYHLASFDRPAEDILTPHKIKQLVIIKLVAEMGQMAKDLRNVLKGADDVGNAVRLRRRIRWIEVKLDSLTKEPLITSQAVSEYYTKAKNPLIPVRSSTSQQQFPSTPTVAISGIADTNEFDESDESEEGFEDIVSPPRFLSHINRSKSADNIEKTSDAVDQYWASEHHQVDHSPLTGVAGFTYHSLDIHRSNSYVKEKGDPDNAVLLWRNKKDYIDPNSEEMALERLSVTVQEMMGRAYNAALDSIPLTPDEVRASKKSDQSPNGKVHFKRPNSILSKMKGQKWMEKKFRHSIHARDNFIYVPPPEPAPIKLLLAKLSDDVYPPIPTSDVDMARQRAKEMPPRFVNQHDLVKKTHLTLYELMFDASKVASKIDVRKSDTIASKSTNRKEVSLGYSATITARGPLDAGPRPKSPANGTVTPKTKPMGRKAQDKKNGYRKNPLAPDTLRTTVAASNPSDRVYMTRSGWYRSRHMPAPIQYITLRLERVKDLMKVIKTETVSVEQKISCAKQISALGITNTEIITDLGSMISTSPQRSPSMDLRFEILKLLLLLGFTDDVVLKELLVFVSSTNHQILCDLLRSLRKALGSPRMSNPFERTSLSFESSNSTNKNGKSLNLLYVSTSDCLLVHRLVQLCQCKSPELSFYAASCLRKVNVMPPPPPLAPPPPPPMPEDSTTISLISDDSIIMAQVEYSAQLEEYQELLKQIDNQASEIAQLTELTFRQIARSGTSVVIDALQELIEGMGATESELFKIAYDLLETSLSGNVRTAVVRLLAGGFARLVTSSTPGTEFRLNEFQEILIRRLIRDTDKQVHTECARTFYKLGLYENICENVMRNLDNKLDVETKMQAIQCAVGLRIRGARITRALVDLLELDASEGIRIAACRALASVGTTDRRALATLRERYERSQGVVGREAGKALAVLSAITTSSTAAFNPAFIDALADQVVRTDSSTMKQT